MSFVCVLLLTAIVTADDIVYPTPETQSAFIKTYTPVDVISRFSLDASQLSGPAGSTAGRGCAFHEKRFQAWLVVATGRQPELMAAVRQDLKSKLAESARVDSEAGSAREGYRFGYSSGKSKCSVVLEPLENVDPATVTSPAAVKPGEVGIILRIQMKETWYKSKQACERL